MKTSEIREAVEKKLKISNRSITRKFIRGLSPKLELHCVSKGAEQNKTWNEILYVTLYGQPKCPTCGAAIVPFGNMITGFRTKYCSALCAGADNEVKIKRANTCLEKYGVDAVQKVKKIRNRFKRSMIENHGVEYTAQSRKLKKKMSRTLQSNFGVSTPFESADIKKRAKETIKSRYGVEHVMQCREVFERQQKTSFRARKFKLQGKSFSVRGYEPEAIKFLAKLGCNVSEILHTVAEGVPSIKYYVGNAEHYYHPDLYVKFKGEWVLAEVKSTYTAGFRSDKAGLFSRMKIKAKATVGAGYKFLLIVVGVHKKCAIIKDLQVKTKAQVKAELPHLLQIECH